MSHARRDLLIMSAALAALVASVEAAAAQSRLTPPDAPKSDIEGQRDPRQDPRSTGAVGQAPQTLSDKLESTGGVIQPPADIAPDMGARAPDPNPGTTRVIPPPGAPGGDPTLQPR
jgi:hypothetical protein